MFDWIEEMRSAARMLRAGPGFSSSAILAIALGIGGVSSIFGLLDAVLWQPLPIAHAERLVAVTRIGRSEAGIGLPDAVAIRPELRGFDSFAAILPDWAIDRVDLAQPERLRGALVEAQYFRAVEVPALAGRLLDPADDVIGAPPVVVLGEAYWRSAFAADPRVLGRRLQLSGVTATVIGVAPEIADIFEKGIQLWMPIAPFAPWAPGSRGSNNFSAVARVAAGQSMDQAAAELISVSQRIAQSAGNADKVLTATPWLTHITSGYRNGLGLLSLAVGLVLLLATANVGALFVVRSARRKRELSVRHALGASGGRMLRQLLSEGLLIGFAGGLLGLLIAWLSFDLLRALASESLPRVASASLSPRVLGFAMLATLSSVCVFSLAPALLWGDRGWHQARSSGGVGSRTERRALAWLVTIEVCLATVLLGSAGLLLRSYLTLAEVPLGIEPAGAISGEVVLPEAGYPQIDRQSQAFSRMVDQLASTPGVTHAGMIVGPPLTVGQSISHTLMVEGTVFPEPENVSARFRPFMGDYFGAVGLAVLAGRAPVAADEGPTLRNAWVNRSFAERFFRGSNVIGARIAWKPGEASDGEQPHWMNVIGVVGDVRSSTLREPDPPAVYAPYLQRDASWIRFGTLVARFAGEATQARQTLAAAVSAGDPNIPLGEVAWMQQRAERALAGDRFNLQMIGSFALVALLLGLQGLFSVVAFAVEQRRSEMGLRLALGAPPRWAVWTLMRDTLKRCLVGAALGLGLSIFYGRWLSSMLYGVSPQDPLTLAIAVALILIVASIAILVPALRTLKIDPKIAMSVD